MSADKNGWHPIETARKVQPLPKPILVHHKIWGLRLAIFYWSNSDWWDFGGQTGALSSDLTHWRPAPKLPAEFEDTADD